MMVVKVIGSKVQKRASCGGQRVGHLDTISFSLKASKEPVESPWLRSAWQHGKTQEQKCTACLDHPLSLPFLGAMNVWPE